MNLKTHEFQFTHPRRMRRDARTTHAGGKTFQFSHVRRMRLSEGLGCGFFLLYFNSRMCVKCDICF